MYREIETDRLILKILDKNSAEILLAFLKKNREDFTKYEAEKQEIYFTKIYQEYVLQNEYDAAMKKLYLRYYLFEKDNIEEQKIIGTVSFSQVKSFPYCSAVLGYKMDVDKKNRGYGTEAVIAACQAAFEYLGLHRLEAYVMEENSASIRLLEKCGFTQEGLCRKNLSVNGEWRDHLLYAKINE
ncbi:MAG: GNAT family protein [Lachnospiraceae bacterium]|nr:GNAT family protein [Lachnospiraceae bacterium]